MVYNRFFYDDGAAENNGGSAAAAENTDTTNVANEANKGTENADNNTDANAGQENQPQFTAEQIAEYNELKAAKAELEELRKFKAANTQDTRTAEEIQREADIDKANFLKFAADNDLMKLDDYTMFESLKGKQDADLVFEHFLTQFKEDNPEITDNEELIEAAKDEFNTEYKLDSRNEKLKERGLARLTKDANEIKSPIESKVKSAEAKYNDEKQLKAEFPKFNSFIEDAIKRNTAPKVTLFKGKEGEEEINIEIDLTKEDMAEIVKRISTPNTYSKYTQDKEAVNKELDSKIQSWLKTNKFEETIQKAAEKYKEIGAKSAPRVGATAPFALQGQAARKDVKVMTLEESNIKIAKAREQYN